MADFKVIKPEQSQSEVGHSYQDLLEMWTTWFISDNPDEQNYSNNVIFLRGLDFPESPEKIGYSGQPAAMVGTHALNILEDQYLFLPVINTFVVNDDNARTSQERSYIVMRDTTAGDNPPRKEQIRIGEVGHDVNESLDAGPFFTMSRDFTLNIPDVPYGRSLKDYLDFPLTITGDCQATAAGWCALFKFELPAPKKAKSYSVGFHARGILDPFGQYYASGIYTINVSPPPPPRGLKESAPPTPAPIVKEKLHRRIEITKQKNELSDEEHTTLKSVIDSL